MINKLKELLEAATPGPWESYEDHDYYQGGTYYGHGPLKWVPDTLIKGHSTQVPCSPSEATGIRSPVFRLEGSESDAQLIVAMRNCLPELLAVVEAAQLMGQAQSMYLESALSALAKKVGE